MRLWPWRKQKDNLADIGAKTAGVSLISATGIIAMHSPLEDAKRRCAESHRRMIQKRINADIREFTENYFKDKVIMDGLEDQHCRARRSGYADFIKKHTYTMPIPEMPDWYKQQYQPKEEKMEFPAYADIAKKHESEKQCYIQPTKEEKMEYEIVKQVTMADVAAMGDRKCMGFQDGFYRFSVYAMERVEFRSWRTTGSGLLSYLFDPIPEKLLRGALDYNVNWYEFMKKHGVVEGIIKSGCDTIPNTRDQFFEVFYAGTSEGFAILVTPRQGAVVLISLKGSETGLRFGDPVELVSPDKGIMVSDLFGRDLPEHEKKKWSLKPVEKSEVRL